MTGSLNYLRIKAHIGHGTGLLSITGTPVTAAQVGVVYAGFTPTISGGVTPYGFSIVAPGALPAGLTLNTSTGAVAGTPTLAGTSSGIVIRATDHNGNTADLGAFSILVQAAGPPVPVIADQTLDFGALTLASAGATVPVNTGGVISASCAITGGTLNGTGWAINAASGALSKGTATVSSGTLICTFGNGAGTQTGVVITINAIANSYSAATIAEVKAVAAAIGTGGGKTIYCRTGATTYNDDGTTFASRAFSSTVTLTPHSGASPVFSGTLKIKATTHLTIDGLTFYNGPGAAGSATNLIRFANASDNIIIQNCRFYGDTLLGPGNWGSAIPTQPSGIGQDGSTHPVRVSILNNTFHDLFFGILLSADIADIAGNFIYRTYTDGIEFGWGVSYSSVSITDNVVYCPIGQSSDALRPAPHADYISVTAPTATANMGGITISRNIFVDTLGLNHQTIFLNNAGPTNSLYFIVTIEGNLLVTGGGSSKGIRVQEIGDGSIVAGNTVVTQSGELTGTAINLGSTRSIGTIIVQNNVADVITVAGSATFIQRNNLTLGIGGATFSYASSFDGPTFAPTTAAQAKTMFHMKASGPVDAASHGGPHGLGATGGYVTWPTTIPGNNGSLDASYD